MSSQRIALRNSRAADRAGVVDRHVDAVVGPLLEAAAEGVAERRQHPPAGVVLGHLGEAGLTGRLGDRRGGLTHLGPRRRRGVGVETGLLEHRPVVVQADAVGADRHAEDGAVGVLGDGEHVGVEVGGVRQGLDLGGDVGHLAALEQTLDVGERDLEHRRQRAAGELGGERGDVVLPLVWFDRDVRVLRLELLDALEEGLASLLLGARRQVAHRDRHLFGGGRVLGAGQAGCGLGDGECATCRQHGGSVPVSHDDCSLLFRVWLVVVEVDPCRRVDRQPVARPVVRW